MKLTNVSEDGFEKELAKFSSIEDLKNSLRELYETDKSSFTSAEIKKIIFEKAVVLPNFFSPIPKDVINLLNVYRVRAEKTMNLETEDLSLIRTFSYPNNCFCTQNGRANLKNKPVFYCSDAKETALAESNLNDGDIIYLSCWKIDCNREANYTAYLPTIIPDKNIWYSKALDLYSQGIAHTEKYGKDKSKHLELLYSFFSEIFVRENKPYCLTSWLANNILYETDIVDFILYPSYATQNYSCNLAFHPNFVDSYLKFNRVFKISITKIFPNKSMNFRVLKTGEVNQTNIVWSNVSQQDIDEFFPGAEKVISQ